MPRGQRLAAITLVLALGGCKDAASGDSRRDGAAAPDMRGGDAGGAHDARDATDAADAGQPDAPAPDAGAPFVLTVVSSMPPHWEAPRLLDGAYTPSFSRSAQGWQRQGVALIPPNKRLLIGPRVLDVADAQGPPSTSGLDLSVDHQPVSLQSFPMLPPETYIFGTSSEAYFERPSGRVFSHGVALDSLAAGSFAVRATSRLAMNGTFIPWVEDVQVVVRPYLRTSFATSPPPALPQVNGRWVVPASATVVRNATVISATGAAPLIGGAVAIVGQWIVGVGKESQFDLSAAPQTIDAQGGFLIPGLINAHVHYVADMHRPAEHWLSAGVTTLVDVGGRLLAVLSAREAFAESVDPRPDLVVAGPIHEAPGTQHQKSFGTPGFHDISTVAQATAAATATADWGVNLLKVCADCTAPDGKRLTVQQLQAIVAVAHQRKLHVMAHVMTDQGLGVALAGGAHVITHIPPLSDARIQQMVAAGVIFVPTLSVTPRSLAAVLGDAARAHAAGVPIAAGNDFPARPRGLPLLELQYLEQAGLSRMEVLEAATRLAAAVAGIESLVGTVQPGRIADLVLLDANPLAAITNLQSVRWVLKRGVLVK